MMQILPRPVSAHSILKKSSRKNEKAWKVYAFTGKSLLTGALSPIDPACRQAGRFEARLNRVSNPIRKQNMFALLRFRGLKRRRG
jgi:hypothetical protein